MKLSIIVPVYRVERYLAACVDSLLAQTIDDYEIILVDDGSPDRSGEIADEYAARFPDKIRVLHIDNGGQGRARNLALPMARGEYVGFVDSDDWIAPDMYEKLLRKAGEEGAEVAVCGWEIVGADGKGVYYPARTQKHWISSAGSACNKIFLRSLVGDVRFPERMWYEDFYFSTLVMMRANRVVFLEEPLYFYRQSSDSTMRNNNSSKNLDIVRVMQLLREQIRSQEDGELFEYLLINHVLLDAINRVNRQRTPDRAETLRKLRSYVRKEIPQLSRCESFKKETRRRQIIMRLNYMGCYRASAALLQLSAARGKGERGT